MCIEELLYCHSVRTNGSTTAPRGHHAPIAATRSNVIKGSVVENETLLLRNVSPVPTSLGRGEQLDVVSGHAQNGAVRQSALYGEGISV